MKVSLRALDILKILFHALQTRRVNGCAHKEQKCTDNDFVHVFNLDWY
jgi:hypothetical protein